GGAHVIAVEIDHELAADLRRRIPKVVEGVAARLEVPREPFKVVANLPFGDGTAILRRLLHPGVSLMTADVSFVPRTSTARTRRFSHAVTATDRRRRAVEHAEATGVGARLRPPCRCTRPRSPAVGGAVC